MKSISKTEKDLMIKFDEMLKPFSDNEKCAILATMLSTYALTNGLSKIEFMTACASSYSVAVIDLGEPVEGTVH